MQLSFQGRCSMERKIVVLAAEGVLALVAVGVGGDTSAEC